MIGTRICELRNKWGWTQTQLAKKLDVSSKAVKNWENSISDPSSTHVIALAKLFSVSADYLLGINPTSYINLDALSINDQKMLTAICQTYMSMTTDCKLNDDEGMTHTARKILTIV